MSVRRNDNASNGRQNTGDSTYRENPNNDFRNPIGSVTYTVEGEGGKDRHRGNFYENNPYFDDLRWANNNEDKDALYERAIEWEADYYNLQEQRAYNEGVLAEQREYDLATNQIARQRAAGINPDIAGGSNGASIGGSSAQMQIPQMADQSAQTKFKNKYDDTELALNGISTAANFVNGLSNSFGTILSGIDLMKTLPSRIKLNESSANLMDTQANEINSLLEGKKRAIDLSNTTALLQQYADLSGYINPDASDDEMTTTLAGLGIEEKSIPSAMNVIKQFHKKPELLDKFHKDTLSARMSEEENEQYSDELISQLTENGIKYDRYISNFNRDYAFLQSSVQNILANDASYAQNQAGLLTEGTEFSYEQLEQQRTEFRRNVEVYAQNLQDLADSVEDDYKQIANIRLDALDNGRQLSTKERAMIDALNINIKRKKTLGSQQLGSLYALDSYSKKLKFFHDDRFKHDLGETEPITSLERHNIESAFIFDNMITHVATPHQIANDIVTNIFSGIQSLGIAAGAGAGVYNTYKMHAPRKPLGFFEK